MYKATTYYFIFFFTLVSGISYSADPRKDTVQAPTKETIAHWDFLSKMDDEAAFGWYLKAAEKGKAFAQAYLSSLYFEGKGIDKDDEQAFLWAEMSASQEYAPRINRLAFYFEEGVGTKKELWKAIKSYKQAALLGSTEAEAEAALRRIANTDAGQGSLVERAISGKYQAMRALRVINHKRHSRF